MPTRIAPGIWEDDNGCIYFSVPELLAAFGWEDTPAERAACERIIMDVIGRHWPGVPIVTDGDKSKMN